MLQQLTSDDLSSEAHGASHSCQVKGSDFFLLKLVASYRRFPREAGGCQIHTWSYLQHQLPHSLHGCLVEHRL